MIATLSHDEITMLDFAMPAKAKIEANVLWQAYSDRMSAAGLILREACVRQYASSNTADDLDTFISRSHDDRKVESDAYLAECEAAEASWHEGLNRLRQQYIHLLPESADDRATLLHKATKGY